MCFAVSNGDEDIERGTERVLSRIRSFLVADAFGLLEQASYEPCSFRSVGAVHSPTMETLLNVSAQHTLLQAHFHIRIHAASSVDFVLGGMKQARDNKPHSTSASDQRIRIAIITSFAQPPLLGASDSRCDCDGGAQLEALEALLEIAAGQGGALPQRSRTAYWGTADKDSVRFASRLKLVCSQRSTTRSFAIAPTRSGTRLQPNIGNSPYRSI